MFNKIQWYPIWSNNDILENDSTGIYESEIAFEIPFYNNGPADLWLLPPILKTKLSVNNIFILRKEAVRSTLKVFVNEISVSFNLTSDNKTFTISGITDGFMYVTYVPKSQDIRNSIIDNTHIGSITRNRRIFLLSYIIDQIQTEVNRIQEYLDIPLTIWRGGQDNKTWGLHPIVKNRTKIFYKDILDISGTFDTIANTIERKAGRPVNISIENITELNDSILKADIIIKLREYINQLEDHIISYGI